MSPGRTIVRAPVEGSEELALAGGLEPPVVRGDILGVGLLERRDRRVFVLPFVAVVGIDRQRRYEEAVRDAISEQPRRAADAAGHVAARVDHGVPGPLRNRIQPRCNARIAVAGTPRHPVVPRHGRAAAGEDRDVAAARECGVDHMTAEEAGPAQDEQPHGQRRSVRRSARNDCDAGEFLLRLDQRRDVLVAEAEQVRVDEALVHGLADDADTGSDSAKCV